MVGDVTKTLRTAAGPKPVWMTLQIAWSGIVPTRDRPGHVPRFPSLHDQRFMAYQAIVNGARGLVFFGGHLTQVATPADANAGWNWTFWDRVLRPVIAELNSADVKPALRRSECAGRGQGERPGHRGRDAAGRPHALRDRRAPGRVDERRHASRAYRARPTGSGITRGEVLHEYVQEPLPPPIGAGQQLFRRIPAANAGFKDWFGPHDARVYRFRL